MPWSIWTPDTEGYLGIPADWAYDFLRTDRHGREPACVAAWAAADGRAGMAILRADAPRTGLRTGDVVVRWYSDPPTVHAPDFRMLSRDDYESLRADLDNAPDLLEDIRPGHLARHLSIPAFLTDRRGWGDRLKQWHPRLGVFRPEVV